MTRNVPSDEAVRREIRAAALLEGLPEDLGRISLGGPAQQATHPAADVTSPAAAPSSHQSKLEPEQSKAPG